MLFKVITVISLINVGAGDVPSNPQPQSNQAISSQSFVRHDVPLSYKYSWVHVYTTPRTDQPEHKPIVPLQHLVAQQPPQIQYAPIHSEQPSQNVPAINTELENTNIEPKPENTHLEHMPHKEIPPEHLSYVPGYNIEVLQTVNRYPGHNAVYRSYPNMLPGEKLNKINFLNQYVLYQNQDDEYLTTTQAPKQYEITTIAPQTAARPRPTIPAFEVKQHSDKKPKPFQRLKSNGYVPNVKTIPAQTFIDVQEYLPHPKAHRMLLNIARTYNIAQNPLKAPHAGLMLKNVPSHTQAFIQIRNPSDADKNSLLSGKNKNLYSPAHRLT